MITVKEIMTPYVECMSPTATIQDAAEKMKAMDVGALLVCDNDRLAGVVTDRDITVRATALGRDPAKTLLKEVLSPQVVYCFEDQSLQEAAQLMREKQLRRIAVLNRNKRLVGIISLGDIALRQDDKTLAAETLESVSACTS